MNIKIYNQLEKEKLKNLTKEARKVSCAEIADNVYGLNLYRSKKDSRYLRCYEHHGMIIDLQKNLVYYGPGRDGLGPYDFIAMYENISLQEARAKLNQYYIERDPRYLQLYNYNKKTNEVFIHQGLLLPKKGMDLETVKKQVAKYHISETVIDNLFQEDLLYPTESGNLVLIGYDENEEPAFGMMYGLRENNTFKIECDGSFTKIGFFRKQEDSKNLVICGSVMDALAYMTMEPNSSVLAASDIHHVPSTLLYNIEKDLLPHGCDIHFAIGNDSVAENIVRKFQRRYHQYPSEIKSVTSIDPGNLIKFYTERTLGIKTTTICDKVEYTGMKDLLKQANQINNVVEKTLESSVVESVIEEIRSDIEERDAS